MKLNTILNSDTSGSADVAFSDEALKNELSDKIDWSSEKNRLERK